MLKRKFEERELTVKERLVIARHASRPKGKDVFLSLVDSFEKLHGDRYFGDDESLIGVVGEIEQRKAIFLVQHKGSNLAERKRCNYGMMNPEGYRKSYRLMKLAEKFSLPIITIVDTPGANPHIAAEKRGQARAIAENLLYMSGVKVPIISLVIGEGSSGGALGISLCDKMIMLEHAYFSVINPEGCASILWKDQTKVEYAATALKMQSEDLFSYGMVDCIIREGREGFHENKEIVMELMKQKIIDYYDELTTESVEHLLLKREQKYRSF